MNRLQNSNLPFINLSKENLFLVCDMLELDEIGTLMVAIKEYIYEGKEPMLNTKALKSAWNQVIMLMDRKADSYFTRKEQMEKINKNKKEKKVEATQPQPIEEKPVESMEIAIEEDFTTENNEEPELDNFSENFNKWLDDGNQEKLIDMATNIVKYEYMGIEVAKTAYEIAKTRFQEMLESFDTQDEKDMLYRHFDELLMLKKDNYKEFFKVA